MLTTSIITFIVAIVLSGVAGYVTRSWLVDKYATRENKLAFFSIAVKTSAIAGLGILTAHVASMAGIPNASAVSNVFYCVLSFASLYVLSALANGSLYTK